MIYNKNCKQYKESKTSIQKNSSPLSRFYGLYFTLLLILLYSTQIHSAEYNDDDIIPFINKMYFKKDVIGFVSVPIFYLEPELKNNIYFVLYRNKKTGKEVSKKEFNNTFKSEIEKSNQNYKTDSTFTTSDGKKYNYTNYDLTCPWVSDVSEYAKRNIEGQHSLKFLGKTIKTKVHVCNDINAIEHVNNNLWIGTGYRGDHGIHGAQGIIIQNQQTGAFVKEIKTIDNWISRILLDPYSKNVWVTTSTKIYYLNSSGEQLSQYNFYHQFDSSSELPIIYLSTKTTKTNPLAVLSRTMTIAHAKEVYQTALSIPKSDVSSIDLYSFFMCCNTRPDEFYPDTMNKLAPIILKELEVLKKLTGRKPSLLIERWIQEVCKINNPKVYSFIKFEKKMKTKLSKDIPLVCVNKFEKKFNQKKTKIIGDY